MGSGIHISHFIPFEVGVIMARRPRIDFNGAWHHVMHRGARKAPIFRQDLHRGLFLDTVERAKSRYELEVHAYALMPNHYHLLVRSRHGNLSAAMRQINGPYTLAVNKIHEWDGPVFGGRFRSQLVRDESRLAYILAYIHLNPLRAGLVSRVDGECWTSHRSYLGRRYAPRWVDTSYFLDLFKNARALQKYVLELHRGAKDWPEELDLRTGYFTEGDQQIAHAKLAKLESQFVEPTLLLDAVSKVCGASQARLRTTKRGRGANPARRFAVWALREHTHLTLSQIGDHLKMSPGQVANVLYRTDFTLEPLRSWASVLLDKM